MSHGQQILTRLRDLMRGLGRKPSDIESSLCIDDYLTENEVKLKKIRKNMPKPRKRDVIFDLLAKLDGQDPAQLTKNGACRIAGAKKQILEVMPEATVDQVISEINRRWSAWCRKHMDRKTQTVMALVTHWAELGGGPKTEAESLNVYSRPDFDWKEWMRKHYPDTAFVEQINDKTWDDVPLDIRKEMLLERQQKS